MQPPLPIQDASLRQSAPVHSVAAIQAQGDYLDDASSFSITENGNNKTMRMLHQYFISLAASGTVRSIVEESNMITDKLRLIFRKVKFINADRDLSFKGDIARDPLQGDEDSRGLQSHLVGANEVPCQEEDG